MKKWLSVIALGVAAVSCGQGVSDQETSLVKANPGGGDALYPQDQSYRDQDVSDSLFEVQEAVKERNLEKLKKYVHPDFHNEIAGITNREEFIKQFDLTDPKSSGWLILDKAMKLGGTFSYHRYGGVSFIVPYVRSAWPVQVDPFRWGAITGDGVNLRSSPSTSASVLLSLKYDLVKYNLDVQPVEANGVTWVAVITDKGLKGWVSNQYLYAGLEYQFTFNKNPEGLWVLYSGSAGD